MACSRPPEPITNTFIGRGSNLSKDFVESACPVTLDIDGNKPEADFFEFAAQAVEQLQVQRFRQFFPKRSRFAPRLRDAGLGSG